MTEKLLGVSPTSTEPPEPSVEELETARQLVRQARSRGVELTGPQGLLKALTKTVVETALDEEMSEHLGYDKHETVGRNLGNSRNGKRSKTLLTSSSGDVQIDMPRDRDGTFEPVIVKKRQRRLTDVDEVVLSLYAKGLTTGEISAHFEQIYRAQGHHQPDHRQGDRGDAVLVQPAAGAGVRGGVHRRDHGQGP
jgi:putative transposase